MPMMVRVAACDGAADDEDVMRGGREKEEG